MTRATENVLIAIAAFVGGVSVGILMAPEPGANTRNRISDGVRQSGNWIEGQSATVASSVRSASSDLAGRHIPMSESTEWENVTDKELVNDLRHMPRR